ncbi:Oidioi.mRNA.OKI2018_I69.chr2.g5521.t1.cds [Oikopleura dioica]|uniref:Oidioi.mRNA.OKI2018_I69.chr2.g5521.t1.cds n=1 Tax=Oikopleura dioica TaxID=34765 RepID=A0ABN7T2B0_OIKDI|nr:Oidioi.mRNA.OKI2018_I69.chr2.g5521.t1.cds [Oikopleura dioica]
MPSIRKVITVFFSLATIGVAGLVAKLFFDEHQRKKRDKELRKKMSKELLETLDKTEPNQKEEFKFCPEENTIRRTSVTRTYPTSEIDTEVVPDDQDSYDEDSFDSATSSSTKSVEEDLDFCDLAAPSTLDCKDDVVEKSSLDGLFNLLEQVLIAEKFQEIISCLEEILFRARIEEQLLEIADHNKIGLVLQCITHASERVILVACQIIEKISLSEKGKNSGIEFVPVLIQAANSQLIQSSKSSGTLEIVTDCIANFSRNYCPEQESAYLSLFDTASRSSLTDGDEFFGASLMKVVVSLSEQNLGQELLQKSETTLGWTERLLEEKQGGKEVQIRCLYAVNNMINETDWNLRRKKSKDVIYEYAQNNNEAERELSTKSSQILELINFSQEQ